MPDNDLGIKRIHHVEYVVGNAKQAAHFYDKSFGFKPVAKMGLETGCRDRASYVMQQGHVRFVLTSALTPDHEVARHCALHGDGAKVIALDIYFAELPPLSDAASDADAVLILTEWNEFRALDLKRMAG